ncbi:hypothetical protein LOD99_11724 [Oopsacas minuta]|uniref:Uncharacterized protein n=1 Tax=Oopsacas minuta TaxID=111878 RepID=A0AAV7JKY3_9METZ|nr:hypothetical protein LOD99_11724 [Oopsacas minuta]
MSNLEQQDIIPTEVNQSFEIGEQLFSRISLTLDRRIRNLDKRRNKLALLEDECKQGKTLNADQKSSLAKIPIIDGNIEMAKEMVGIIKDTSSEYSGNRAKFVTKKPNPKREERAPKLNLTVAFSQLLQFHSVLTSFAKIDTTEKTAKDYAELQLSENDLDHLRSFLDVTQLWDPTLESLHSEFPSISKQFSLLVESSKENFQDKLSYNRLHKILLALCSVHNMKILDGMVVEAIALAEDLEEYALEDTVSPSIPQHKSTTTTEVPAPIEELIPSQTILNQSAEPLTEEMFISSTSRLANSATDNTLIETTVFVPSEIDNEPECVSKPRVITPIETTHIDIPPVVSADTIFTEQIQEPIPTQVISFSGINLSNVVSEEDFDFLHDSEISVKQPTKPFSTSQQPIQSSIFAASDSTNTGFMSARLPETNYKTRTQNLNMYPARQQATSSAVNYPDVDIDSDMMKHYTRGNQTDIQRPPQQMATSSLAQPFTGMVVENSGAGRVESAWNRK